MVVSLKLWSYYLYGVHADVFTDYKSLHYVFTQRELNLLKKRQCEFLKDNDKIVHYHSCKGNIIADALSRLSIGSSNHTDDGKKEFVKDVHKLAKAGVRLMDSTSDGV